MKFVSGPSLFVACLALWAATPAAAQFLDEDMEKKLHAPGPMPDRIVLTWRGDPTRSQSVTWRTDTSVAKGTAVAEVAVSEAGPKFRWKARSVPAVTTLLKTDLSEAHYHTVDFTNLTARTKYVYRVGDGTYWSEWCHFQTAAEQPEPFSFLYFGDAQLQIRSHWSRLVREAYATAPRARFAIHAGDLINSSNRDAEWGEWCQAAGWINTTVPVVPTPGNHEYTSTDDEGNAILARHWRAQFALPENGPSAIKEGVYYFDYQGVRIVSLDSNDKLEEQIPWLERVLSKNPNRWTILTFHHPVFVSTIRWNSDKRRQLWKPIIDKYRVDLVLQGHDHIYGRSPLIGGTVYVISVSGPDLRWLDKTDWMKRSGEGKQLFQVIHIDGDRLRYEARSALGELHDSFELRKQARGQPNLLIEGKAAPDSKPPEPERSVTLLPIIVLLLLMVVLVWLRVARRRAATPLGRGSA